MEITKHACARFKQRQKIKNKHEMMRRSVLAVTRGTLLLSHDLHSDIHCYEYAGFRYVLSGDDQRLITVYSARRPLDDLGFDRAPRRNLPIIESIWRSNAERSENYE